MGKKNSKSSYLTSPSLESSTNNMDTVSYGQFPIQELPDDILVEVFVRVPGKDLAKSCTRVCKRWYDLLKTQKLWKDKCQHEYYFPHDTLATLSNTLHVDFKYIYFCNPYNRNLLKNPDASQGFNDWQILRNGGNKFKQEVKPCGCNSLSDYAGPDHEGTGCWVTSYGECYKQQIIDLLKEGCSEEVLDEIRPSINISEWYAARFDCGMKYSLHVRLLNDSEDKIPIHEFKFEDTKPAGRDWFNVTHTFKNYNPGVRYIQYVHGGIDTQFWAGHYGSKFTLSTVQFDLEETRHWPPVEKFARNWSIELLGLFQNYRTYWNRNAIIEATQTIRFHLNAGDFLGTSRRRLNDRPVVIIAVCICYTLTLDLYALGFLITYFLNP